MRQNKWQAYADRMGLWTGDFLNETVKASLKAGIQALVRNTVHDSSRAASHWVVIPNKGRVSPGAWKQMTFQPAHGVPPVGRPGDKGKNLPIVLKDVTDREMRRSVNKAVSGRKPATTFLFHNVTPTAYNDTTGEYDSDSVRSGDNYRKNAKLEEAKQAALDAMYDKFRKQWERGNTRKIPLR